MIISKGTVSIIVAAIVLVAGAAWFLWQYPSRPFRGAFCASRKFSGRGAYMPNPASAFCTCMGGKLSIQETSAGQAGRCQIGSRSYDEWEYYRMMNPHQAAY